MTTDLKHVLINGLPNARSPKFCSNLLSSLDGEVLRCRCGEVPTKLEWLWDETVKTDTVFLSEYRRVALFNARGSFGTACVRGDTPFLEDKEYYWEIKLLGPVYGTSNMIGIGTENVNVNQSLKEYKSLVGSDSESWGLRHDGGLYHNSQWENYHPCAGFNQGTIIGVHLDMFRGTIEFYLNRVPLGIAFSGFRGRVLYPYLSSTATRAIMKLTFASSMKCSLALTAMKKLPISSFGELPRALQDLKKKCYWYLPKSNQKLMYDDINMDIPLIRHDIDYVNIYRNYIFNNFYHFSETPPPSVILNNLD